LVAEPSRTALSVRTELLPGSAPLELRESFVGKATVVHCYQHT
jgi:hypothetical protein